MNSGILSSKAHCQNKQHYRMKNLYSVFIIMVMSCVATFSAYASEPYKCYPKGLFALDLSVGTNIDLSSLSQEQKSVFEERPM